MDDCQPRLDQRRIVASGFTRVGLYIVAALAVGCGRPAVEPPAEPIWSISGPTMGTRYSVSLVEGSEAEADTVRLRIDERLAELNRRMSTYDPRSELSRFNASDSLDWFAVSDETADVTAYALAIARDSGGAYDPTVGPLVNLWGFGPAGPADGVPSDERIATAQSTVGYERVEVRADPPALRKTLPGVELDLSSVAKGHGVDAVASVVEDAGYDAFMVEIGGEVVTAGAKPNGSPWRIGVERADEPLRQASGKSRLQRVVELRGEALATSGDYRNFFEADGVRYSHTLDPETGRPVTHDLATVTVRAATCREADALATALLVLGPQRGYDWALERDVAAVFVSRGADDELSELITPAWEAAEAETATADANANPSSETPR